MPPLREIEHDGAGTVVARLQGDIDSSNVAELKETLETDATGKKLVIDLSDVQYIDSAGMSGLESLRRSAEVVVIAPRASTIRRALEVVGFDQLVPVLEGAEALPGLLSETSHRSDATSHLE